MHFEVKGPEDQVCSRKDRRLTTMQDWWSGDKVGDDPPSLQQEPPSLHREEELEVKQSRRPLSL